MNETKRSGFVVPPEVRVAMESAGVSVTTDPETGCTSFGLNGFFLARVELDPPSLVWGNAGLGKFLGDLFAYQEWLQRFQVGGREAGLPRSFLPGSTIEAAGISVRKSGNSFFGVTTIFAHPAFGEFVRVPSDFRPMKFSSPNVLIPLRFLVNLDELLTPVAHGSGSSLVYLSPYQTNLYRARREELERLGHESGFDVTTFELVPAGDDPRGKKVKVQVDLTEDPDEEPESRWTAYRQVIAAFGADTDIVSVVIDFDDYYGERGGRVVTNTAELTRDLADDDVAFEAYAKSHGYGFNNDMRLEELERLGHDAGFHIGTYEIAPAGNRGVWEVKVEVDLIEDPSCKPEARWTAYRQVVAAIATDADVVSVVIDFRDEYGERGGRFVTDTAELTADLADDDVAFDAYLKSHVRGFNTDLVHLCDAWEQGISYVDSEFRQLITKEGAIGAARLLLGTPQVSAPFAELAATHKLDLSVEYLILRPEWAPLFTQEERECAQNRLIEHGIEETLAPPSWGEAGASERPR